MRYEYIVPAAPGRNEIAGKYEADTETHVRAMLRAAINHQAAMDAIVRPAKGETLEQTVNRRAGA